MMYEWPIIDEKLEMVVINQLKRSLSDIDSKGVIGEVESVIKDYYKTEYAVFFSCATGAMHSLYYALDFKPGDEIIVPSYTFFATFSPFAYEGVNIIQADCDNYGNISASEIERLHTDNTKAVVLTHMWGIPCDMDEICRVCEKLEIKLIEDCSHAHLATYKGKKVGTFGDVGIFSTNQKVLTSGEGGYLITNHKEIFEKSIVLGHYNKRVKQEVTDSNLTTVSLTGLGLKYRGSTIGAAILKEQFARVPVIKSQRGVNYQTLFDAVEESTYFENICPPYDFEPGLYTFPFMIKNEYSSLKNDILKISEEQGFRYVDSPGSTRPLIDQPLFFGQKSVFHRLSTNAYEVNIKNASNVSGRLLKLPLFGKPNDGKAEEIILRYADFIKKISV